MKFSIITPSFNQGKFLEETIKSVVSQKVELEYFIQDGGSTDGSIDIIKRYAAKYPYIKWESKKDKGQVDALNRCLQKCTGDVIAYINSDDYYLSNALNIVEKYFTNHPKKSWLVGDCRVSDPKLSWTFSLKHFWPISINTWFLKVFNTINQPSVFLRNNLVKKVGLFDTSLKYAFDYDFWLRCLAVAGTPARLRRRLSVFRIHSMSKGNTGYKNQFSEDLKVISKYSDDTLIIGLHQLGKYITELSYRNLKNN
jgi:glycosyltransferase involved in cell wall biosynthesis